MLYPCRRSVRRRVPMRNVVGWIGIVCLTCIAFPACTGSPEKEQDAAPESFFDQRAEEEAIRDVIQQGIKAHNTHDAKGVVAFLDEEYENWDGSRKGPAAFVETFAEQFERAKDIKYQELEHVRTAFVTPDVAIYKSVGEFSGQVDAEGNNLLPQKVARVHILVKRNDKWFRAARFNIPIPD
jgi:uncharacterized protein (TIGR02246 family)